MAEGATLAIGDQIAALEPLSAAALAMCLAYLALDRFRYRDKIEKHAAELLQSDEDALETIVHTESAGHLIWLAGKHAPDLCETAISRAKQDNKDISVLRPKGAWSAWYWSLFRNSVAEIIITILAILAFSILLTGVCFKSDNWLFIANFLAENVSINALMVSLVSGSILPVAFVMLGRKHVAQAEAESSKLHSLLQNDVREIRRLAKKMADEAEEQTIPQP